MEEWFGQVRWCEDDLKAALEDQGYPVTENNIANTVTGVVTTAPTAAYATVPDNANNNQGGNNNIAPPGQLTTVPLVTTEPFGEEGSSNGSLADLLEQDSAAVIIQTPTETVITINKSVFHTFLYPPANTHYVLHHNQKYLSFVTSQ